MSFVVAGCVIDYVGCDFESDIVDFHVDHDCDFGSDIVDARVDHDYDSESDGVIDFDFPNSFVWHHVRHATSIRRPSWPETVDPYHWF
jgi:hypothetical protein